MLGLMKLNHFYDAVLRKSASRNVTLFAIADDLAILTVARSPGVMKAIIDGILKKANGSGAKS